MSLPKLFNRIIFHNNTTPALNETNLNLLSKAVDDIDDRVIALGGDIMEVVPQIQAYLEQADDLVEALELMVANPPYIGENGHWYTWDTETGAYVDSGIDASITVEIADITMLSPDATPYVTNSGTDTDPVFHLFIPRGQTGAAGQDGQDGQDGADGQDGVSPTVTITTITGGHRITITDADHPSGQSFDVMDGTSGGVTSFNGRTGIVTPQSGDYTASDVGAVASNGGEAGDTIVTFTDPSQDGNITSGTALKTIIGLIKYKLSHITGGGHIILNGSGSAMNARSKLQFVGGNVKDDSTNDKTVVTVDRELTQAEYDALSTAEQNNGTNYFITDAPSSYTGVPQSMIGDAWVLGHAYAVGDYSIDANGLYKNGTAHTSTATNRPSVNQSGYWTAVSVASQLGGGGNSGVAQINYDKVAINGTITANNVVLKRYLISDIDFMEINILKANKNSSNLTIYGVTTVVFASAGAAYGSALTYQYAKFSNEEYAKGTEVQGTTHVIGVEGSVFHDSASVNMAELKKAFPSAVEIGVSVTLNSYNNSVDVAALVKTVKVN